MYLLQSHSHNCREINTVYRRQQQVQQCNRLCLSIRFHSDFWTKWPWTFCTSMGHDHSSREIEGQGQRSRLTCGWWDQARVVLALSADTKLYNEYVTRHQHYQSSANFSCWLTILWAKKRGSTFAIITLKILIDFINFYIFGNRNEWQLCTYLFHVT